MKKVLIITGGFIALIFVFLLVAPFLFKDKIKSAIDEEIAKNVNAKVYFDSDKFSLSLIRNFPNLSVSLRDFGVAGNDPFAGDTLVSVNEFKVVVDLMSVFSGNYIIKDITLDNPKIKVIVLKDGKTNYDIYIGTSDTTQTESAPSKFNLKINKWEIINGNIVYDDRKTPTYANIKNLNHTGSGDFSSDILDLATQTDIEAISVSYNSVSYLSNNKVGVKLVLNMDMPNQKYTFKDNEFKINDFSFGFDGWVQTAKDSSINVDLTYKVKEISFKNILSLVPGIYTSSFQDIKANGTIGFDGFAKGTYKGNTIPAFGLALLVKDGMFQYSKLPTPVKNIQVDLKVENKDGILDNTIVDLKQFHLDFGSNPVDARALVKGLKTYDIDAEIKAKIDLAEATNIFPIDSLTLKGIFSFDAKAKGVYKNAQQLPALNVQMNLANGYAKSDKMPNAPLEKISSDIVVTNSTGLMKDLLVDIRNVSMEMLGEPFSINGTVKDLDDIIYNLELKGKVDIEKITKIFPLQDMTIKGKVAADITTAGKMSLIKASRYDQLATKGSIKFSDFFYSSSVMPQGFKMTEGVIDFDPQKINISKMNGFIGKSDFSASGLFTNYMPYIFQNKSIKGNIVFNSKNFELNEWMGGESSDTARPSAIPKNIDIAMVSKLDRVVFQNLEMTGMVGNIYVKDGIFKIQNGFFKLLDGSFKVDMAYDTQDSLKPGFIYAMDIQNLDFKKAYQAFNSIQQLAPVAKNIEGKFNTNLSIDTKLGRGYKPLYPTTNGKGTIFIADAKLTNMDFLNKVNSIAKITNKNLSETKINNTTVKFEIKNGRVYFEPFNIGSGDYVTVISGSQGLDQTVDYLIKTNFPGGAAGNAASQAMAKYTGSNIDLSKMQATLKATGSSTSPNVSLVSITTSNGVSPEDAAKQALSQKAKQEAEKVKQDLLKKAEEEAKKRLQDEQVQKLKQEAEKLKNKVKLPF